MTKHSPSASLIPKSAAPVAPRLTVIVVSYNTRALTLTALASLFATTRQTPFEVIVWDNASSDGSADAIAIAFPRVTLIRSLRNIGFAAANNQAAKRAKGERLLLLNPDTECHEGAVDRLMTFADTLPAARIWGGRTVFPDGALNPSSCLRRMSLWSVACRSLGLIALWPGSSLFNPEAISGWQRDSMRFVDIVSGAFFMVDRLFWERLRGFDSRYFMFGEEADLCLRAAELGARPAITPDAQIMHLVGAAQRSHADKIIRVSTARIALMKDHWPARQAVFGRGLMWFGAAARAAGTAAAAWALGGPWRARAETHRAVWRARHRWLAGY